MSNLARLLMRVPAAAAIVAPSTVNFTSAQFVPGFTGPLDTTTDAAKVYVRVQMTLWSGWITGTEAKWLMSSDYGDFDGAVQVAVDGGAFSAAPRSSQTYTLFTALPQAAHFVEIRIATGLGNVAYTPSTGNVLTVTGAPPALQVLANKVQTDADTSFGWYSGALIDNPPNFYPQLQAPSGVTYGSNVGSFRIKGAFTKLVVTLNGARKIGVSKNGTTPTFYSVADETDSPVRAITVALDGSTSTYNVWDSGNSRSDGGPLAIAVDSAFLDMGTPFRRLDQYGDSVSAGAGPGATAVDVETMKVAASLGFVGSTSAIAGQTIIGCETMIATILPLRRVTASDVAVLAIGGNSASDGVDSTEQTAYSGSIDKLLAKGYGKVLCRGILRLADGSTDTMIATANATLKAVMDGKSDSRLVWINTSTWTGYATEDGVHPTAAGYVTLAGFARPAYATALGL